MDVSSHVMHFYLSGEDIDKLSQRKDSLRSELLNNYDYFYERSLNVACETDVYPLFYYSSLWEFNETFEVDRDLLSITKVNLNFSKCFDTIDQDTLLGVTGISRLRILSSSEKKYMTQNILEKWMSEHSMVKSISK